MDIVTTETTMSSTEEYYTMTTSTASELVASITRELQRAPSEKLADDLTDSNSSFIRERFGLFIFVVACSISLVVILCMVIREYYWKKYGVDVCPGTGPRGRAVTVTNQIMSDQAMAVELQRQLNEEIREQERLEKRKERRAWYESYIKPYTMVVEDKHFLTATEEEAHIGLEAPPTHDSLSNISFKLAAADEVEDYEESEELDIVPEGDNEEELGASSSSDIELGRKRCRKMTSDSERTTDTAESSDSTYEYRVDELDKIIEMADDEEDLESTKDANDTLYCHDVDTHLYLKLPVKNKDGSPRCVDAHCAICIGEYEAGDNVVWSGLDECKHAFHDECILPWLSKGKKRCPVCRYWFVPGTKIDDQKAALQAAAGGGQSDAGTEPASPTTSVEGDNNETSTTEDSDNHIELERPSVEDVVSGTDLEDVEVGVSTVQGSTSDISEPSRDVEMGAAPVIPLNATQV